MKNFKKVLALVLAVATVFSFAAMATAADVKYEDLTDTATITHKEAVQVLTGVGVIQGFEDKTFKPAEPVTRVQMAKMVGFIMNDGDDINDLYKAACPFADSKSNWGAGYIAYCATQGIVNGRDANTFDPNATVTGTEAAKMLLCALGYDATIEGFVGSDWAVNVLKVAKTAGLTKELSQSKMAVALTREDAAQMIFNALNAAEVKYPNKGTTVTINGATIATGAQAAEAIQSTNLHFDGTKDKKDQLWGETHFIDSEDTAKQLQNKPASSTDAFGVKATVWTYGKDGGKAVEIAKNLSTPKTYAGSFSAEDLYVLTDTIDTTDEGKDEVSIYVNGKAIDTDAKFDETFEKTTGITLAKWTNGDVVNKLNAANRAKNKLVADEIEVYVTDKTGGGRTIQIIGKTYFLGEITDHKGVKVASDTEKIIIDEKAPATDLAGLTYDTEDFTDADADNKTKVLFTYSYAAKDGGVKSVKKVDAVQSGKVTKIATDSDKNVVITADGKTYTFTKTYKTTDFAIDGEYDLYLAPNGKVIYKETTKAGASDYFMVMKKGIVTGSGIDAAETVYQVRLLGADGKTVDLNVAEIDGAKAEGKWNDLKTATVPEEDQKIEKCEVGDIVTYKLNNKGEAKLTKVTKTTNTAYNANMSYDNLTDISTRLTGTTYTASSRTTFVLISLDKNDNYVFTAISGTAAMKSAFGGYRYMSKFVVDTKDHWSNVTVYDKATTDAKKDTAAVAFIFVGSRTATSAKKAVFSNFGASDKITETTSKGDIAYYEVNVIDNGEVKVLKVLEDAYKDVNFFVASSYEVDDDGFVKRINAVENDYVVEETFVEAKNDPAITFEDGELIINGTSYTQDSCKVYLWNDDDEAFRTVGAGSLKYNTIVDGSKFIYVKSAISGTATVEAIYAIENVEA